jgi:hypothetical protein
LSCRNSSSVQSDPTIFPPVPVSAPLTSFDNSSGDLSRTREAYNIFIHRAGENSRLAGKKNERPFRAAKPQRQRGVTSVKSFILRASSHASVDVPFLFDGGKPVSSGRVAVCHQLALETKFNLVSSGGFPLDLTHVIRVARFKQC